MSQEQKDKVVRAVLVGDPGVGKSEVYQWLLERSEDVTEVVGPDKPKGTVKRTSCCKKENNSPPGKQSCKRVYPSKQLQDIENTAATSITRAKGNKEVHSTSKKFLRFNGIWRMEQQMGRVQVTCLPACESNASVLQECLDHGVTMLLLMYDISNLASFHGLQTWIENLRDTPGGAHRMMVIVGNRLDCTRSVSVKEVQTLLRKNSLSTYVESCCSWDHQMEAMLSLIMNKMQAMCQEAVQKTSKPSLICPKEASFEEFRFQRERRAGGHEFFTLVDGDDKVITWKMVLDLWQSNPEFCRVCSHTLAQSEHSAFVWETNSVSPRTLANPFKMVLMSAPHLTSIKPDMSKFKKFIKTNTPVSCFANQQGNALLVAPSPWAHDSCYTHLACFVRKAPEYQQIMFWKTLGNAVLLRMEEVLPSPLWVSTCSNGVHWMHVRLDSYPKYYKYSKFAELQENRGFLEKLFRKQ